MSDIYFKFNTPPCSNCHVEMKFNSIFSRCNICTRTYIIFNKMEEQQREFIHVNSKTHFCFNRDVQDKTKFCHCCGLDEKVLEAFYNFRDGKNDY